MKKASFVREDHVKDRLGTDRFEQPLYSFLVRTRLGAS